MLSPARRDATGERPVVASPGPRWLLDSEHHRNIVNGLRAIGIILVVAFHGAFVFAKILPRPKLDAFVASMPSVLNVVWQALGSEVVFYASGFLLSYLLLREHGRHGAIDVRRFWIRRASRIVPLFLVALALFMIGRTFHWDRLLTNLLFCARIADHFDITAHGGKNYIPVGWSLEVMVHAYLLLPFVVLGVLRTRWPLTAALVLAIVSLVPRYLALAADPAACAMRAYEIVDIREVPQTHRDLYYLTWFRLTPFLLGLATAIAVTHGRASFERWFASRWRANATVITGLVLAAASASLPLHSSDGFVYDCFGPNQWLWFWTCQRAVLISGLALVLLAVLSSPHGISGLIGRGLAMRCFGPISHGIYSIYLFHFACLVPAAIFVFLPSVIEGLITSPSLDRKVLLQHFGTIIQTASVWQYLAMVAIAVWLSTRMATWLTRVIEAPVQQWLRARSARA